MKLMRAFMALALVCLWTAPMAMADSDAMQAEINALKARLADLESKVASAPQTVTSSGTPVLTLPSMMEGVSISGQVNATYGYNFNDPTLVTGNENFGRVFDREANSFNVNVAEIVLQKPATVDHRVGFRTDLYFGSDSEVIGSAGLGSTTDEFDLEQAYVEILAPTSNWGWQDTTIKAGKFVTPLGAEVIESKDNWNTSRGFLFGYAIPFTHTGVYATTPFSVGEQPMHVSYGVVNGWDIVDDNNSGKSYLWQWGIDGIVIGDSKLTPIVTGVWGSETATSHNARNVTDLVIIYNTPWKPLTLMYNYDYGHEDNLLAPANDGNWWGHAVYARYDINDQWSLSGRGEYFDDTDNQRLNNGGAFVSSLDAEYWEATITLEYRPWKNLITRLEYRHDDADRSVFSDDSIDTIDDTQDTISVEAIVTF